MSELPHLIKDLALILIVAGIVTLLFKKLKQPLVLGYVVAGFLVSPHMPYTLSVFDKADIQVWADIGVMFLLFSLGLDFRMEADGLHISRRYACHEFHDNHLQGFRRYGTASAEVHRHGDERTHP